VLLSKLHDEKQGNEHCSQRNEHFPGAGIVFAVGVFVFPVGIDLRRYKDQHEENNEGNLAGREFHVGSKGNARQVIPYFWNAILPRLSSEKT
jgi:hypothetical protein